ncbi:MAG: single-stranded-DNA-specific exonuclease RecJ [Treponema sp.]|jgi:single-stranded-DNA-specific exonuclease|nr:single-stranded-DNA-specific exonuclease RecJ [Treponema sp.]
MQWDKKDIPQTLVKDIAERYGCDLLTASILARRGIINGEDIRYFLENDPRHLRNPFELPDMADAVERILAAKEEGEKVLIFGDRDVDGITSTVLLYRFLAGLGMDVSWRIPLGDAPYGLSINAVEDFAKDYGTLIITVDCGISNIAEVARARELSIDVIITDHHNQQEQVPDAFAIVNPKRTDSVYPFRDLCGCGVAYKLVSALRFALKSDIYEQPICLLNTRLANDTYIIEIAKLRNLTVVDTLTETLLPDTVRITETRLPAFLEGQQIMVWDAPLQRRTLAKIFGNNVEVQMLDIAPEIGKEIHQAASKSLLRIKELSRIARYADREQTELDVFISLFTSFMQKREQHFTADDIADLQLVSLGTIADIMPLRDENRLMVRAGINALDEKPRLGLSDLLFKLGLAGHHLASVDLSWKLCPAINAAGRMGSPDKAIALLLEDDPRQRDALANELIAMNDTRKKQGADAWIIVEKRAAETIARYDGMLALASGEEIARGITGIMANRLLDRFRTTAIVVSFGNGVYVGSARSPRGVDLHPLLEQCADLFIDWGGHDCAAGFSLEKAKWPLFLERLKTTVHALALTPVTHEKNALMIDAELPHSYLTPDLLKLIDRFEPYGEANDTLCFMAKGLRIVDLALVGKVEAKHVKLTLDAGKHKWPALYWSAVDKVRGEFDIGDKVDLVFTVTRNWFNGTETPQIIVSDLHRSTGV